MSVLSSTLGRFALPLLTLATITSATNLRLSQVQPIIGFSASCTEAYDTRLPDCSLDDLLSNVGGRNLGCSASCTSQLNQLQLIVQSSCQGERASRNTVIGQMFLGTVNDFLCGGSVGGASSVSTTTSVSSISTATTSMSTAAPMDSTTTSETTSESSTSTSETLSSTDAPSSSLTETTESASTSTAQATESTGGSQGDQGDESSFDGTGGGSPFDGGPGEFDSAAPHQSLYQSPLTSLLTLAGMLVLL